MFWKSENFLSWVSRAWLTLYVSRQWGLQWCLRDDAFQGVKANGGLDSELHAWYPPWKQSCLCPSFQLCLWTINTFKNFRLWNPYTLSELPLKCLTLFIFLFQWLPYSCSYLCVMWRHPSYSIYHSNFSRGIMFYDQVNPEHLNE